ENCGRLLWNGNYSHGLNFGNLAGASAISAKNESFDNTPRSDKVGFPGFRSLEGEERRLNFLTILSELPCIVNRNLAFSRVAFSPLVKSRRHSMDMALVLRQRLEQLDLEQRDLAAAAQVTESYISQLLSGRKAPPAPARTDIYDKLEPLLKFPKGELARMAELRRQEDIKKKLAVSPAPLFKEVRELVLGKCRSDKRKQLGVIFEQQPFGELERLVTQKLLEVAKEVARKELANEKWLHQVARLSPRSYEKTRVNVLEFLDEDVFSLSPEHCVAFLQPLIDTWDIDLKTFGMDIILNHRVAPGRPKKFEYVERDTETTDKEEPGLTEFLQSASLSRNTTAEEIDFLRKLRFNGKRPTALYYYRELQNLRDPLHFQLQ